MDNKEFAGQLEKRTQRFAVTIIELSTKLPNTEEARVIRNQITKSGTSIGANCREANRARSKADFKKRSEFVRAKPAKRSTGSKSSKKPNGFPGNIYSQSLKSAANCSPSSPQSEKTHDPNFSHFCSL